MKKFIPVLVLVLLFAADVYAADATWTAVVADDLDGYRAYLAHGTCAAPGPFTRVATFSKTAVSGVFPTPTDDTYCGKLTAFDTAGNESGPSNLAQVTVNKNPPTAPAGLLLSVP